ncbi:carbohydrate ABC transporter permease [Mycoplasma sp. Ms02]|uniref:carbohydrate ABC transporter permease n=1 Tax=Mycoplasma sp. Ms02 TaxID=353851 RepID=UPI001C89F2B0|nr:sugar ABC transporter permease [Mycoplasma sp. Ms02]QZE12121.1 sugar ABC transporter permease [Mycoplasma sp. Ms02]
MYKKRYFFSLVLPALIIFAFVVAIPTILGFSYAFTDWDGGVGKALNFVGFKNFGKIFEQSATGRQPLTSTIVYTLVFSMASLVTINLFGFGLAYILNQKFIKGRNILRGAFFLPNLLSGLVLGYLWQKIFDYGITSLFPDFLNGESIRTAGRWWGLFAMVIVYTWQMAGYVMVIYIAALQNVNKTLVEAAKIEGASRFKIFRSVILPSIVPAITISFFLVISGSFKMFDLNFAIAEDRAGFSFLAVDIYKTASVDRAYGLAQAKSVIFVILVSLISVTQVYITKKYEVKA